MDFDQAKGSIGSLLLLFCAIERSAKEALARIRQGSPLKPGYGFSAIMNDWEAAIIDMSPVSSLAAPLAFSLRAQLQEPINLRNGICHGLRGISASNGEIPATLTWELNGDAGSIAWNELQACFQWLSKVPFAISLISAGSSDKPGCMMQDSAENREWWRSEYGIDILETLHDPHAPSA